MSHKINKNVYFYICNKFKGVYFRMRSILLIKRRS